MNDGDRKKLLLIIKQYLKKKNSNSASDDEYKEEQIRDWTKERRQNFLDSIAVKTEDNLKESIKKDNPVYHRHDRETSRLLYTKRYEGIDNISQITDSDIWKCKADFSTQQQKLIRHLVQLESVKMGIPRPKIIFDEMDEKENTLGYYDYDNKIIFINSSTQGLVKHLNLLEVIDTASHELRHSYQHHMMECLEKFPFVDDLVQQYYKYEKKIYPDDDRLKTDDGIIEYLENALEVDARSYANECVSYYAEKTLPEMESLESVIDEPVYNQILLGLRDETPNGNNPLMMVGRDFEEFKNRKRVDVIASSSKHEFSSSEKSKNISKNINVKGEQCIMASGMTGGTDLSESAQETAAKRYMEVVENIQRNCENMIF